ncbi:cytosolic 5'-nucleotidase 1A [Nerophis lumbriciformis]|uniref:cytosolic 5'-nucleotidase 1A n=1 Tax=Nerophis lumbriciformis TaxID=546530 RepID=UPI002AE030FF|nr:cytosolic 5'-nucleotidase 1A-like [Nerophis lumbriciformis]XP_061780641.1 cytosolic 5'-nucleotidase 1A-like [Nerophis lumbriciformis]
MVSTTPNSDVRQKDADQALVVAISSSAVFEAADEGDEVHGVGVAFLLLQALQSVNRRLLAENPEELLLFDVLLITTDSRGQRQSARIVNSTKHYGLEVSRFCFASQDDFIESLLQNKVQLFLSTHQDEVSHASHRGVLSALLDQQTSLCPSEQLRVLFCGDEGPTPADSQAAQHFWCRLGAMRRRFGVLDSPLSIIAMTCRGGMDRCGDALKTLRSHDVSADEAYCLAGAPRGPILSVLRPHFLLGGLL